MKIIIAGGSGLIGSELSTDLIKDGHEVVILSRNPDKISRSTPGLKIYPWDGKTHHGWGKLAEGVDAIVNLAGANIAGDRFFPTRWTKERKHIIQLSRINAGQAITEAVSLMTSKPKLLVQASAIGYYGPMGDEPIDETAPSGRDFLAHLGKEWEQSTKDVEAQGVRRVIIRTGVVLSKQGGALPRMLLPYKLYIGGPFGSGRQVMSWIHITDEIKAIRYLIDHPEANGIYNLTAPQPVTNAELGKEIGKIIHRPHYLPIPGFAMRLFFGEVATVVLDGQRVLPNRLLTSGFNFQFPNISMALSDIL